MGLGASLGAPDTALRTGSVRTRPASTSPASADLQSIDGDVKTLIAQNKDMCSAKKADDVMVEVRDFQTAGVVSVARGCPFTSRSRDAWT